MIGDKLWTDIIPAKARGFKTIQYTGYTDYGRFAEADFVISDFWELKTILRGPKEKQ
jgi:FMN phosphatase YigB (HAD superfamily)